MPTPSGLFPNVGVVPPVGARITGPVVVHKPNAARRLVKKFYLYFNNHFASKAVVNAVMIKHQLGEPVPGTYTKEFVERYPETGAIVRTEGAMQFALE